MNKYESGEYVPILPGIPRDDWALQNIRFPEVFMVFGPPNPGNRQASHTDRRPENRTAARGAGRRGGMGSQRVTHQGTSEGWGLGIGTGGSEKAVKV